MKRVIFTLIVLLLFFKGTSQCGISTAVDFTATDCHGTEINLFSILDEGKYVCIDFFFTSCPPCQAAVPKVKQAYEMLGCNEHEVFFMEIAYQDDEAACLEWCETYGIEYPTIAGTAGGTSLCVTYDLEGFPTVILIAPNREIVIQDVYPIPSAQTIVNAFAPYGIQEHDCGGESDCPAPTNLTATSSAGNTINLNWEGASDGSETLSWSGDYAENAIGTNAAADFDVAHKFEAADLSNYVGWRVTKIAFVPCVANCTYSLRAWSGDNAETMILDQEVSGVTMESVNEFTVNSPVTIESNKAFYFGYRCNTQEGYPAGIDAGPAIAGKGDLVHLNGEWAAISGMNLNCNFCIVTTVSNDRGEEANLVLTPDTDRSVSGTLSVTELPVSIPLYGKDRSFSYKVYRDNAEIATVSETSFTDPNLPNGSYTYYVKTVCDDNVLSNSSNQASATVSINELQGSFNIYPNPAKEKIYVEGENMEQVSLYNILGQQLETITTIENRTITINTSQLEGGVYMIRITDREGNIVSKRVIVTN